MVSIQNVTKNYGDFHLNISMEIPEGCITGLVGKNGAGKSTTIKAILGLINPESGSVYVMGKDVTKLTGKDKQKLGVCLAESGFSPYITVKDVAKILSRCYESCDEAQFLAACKAKGLPENKKIQDFSTGMKAKLRVMTALSHDADLLIMDEPTAGLDIEARNEILDILREYLAENESRSILITSHIATDLEGICDDIYLIHDGKVVLHEETDVILSDYAIIKTTEDTFAKMDKQYFMKVKKEAFGYSCLTKEKQFYQENYPGLIMEKAGIDDLILMMTGGK